MKAVHIIRHARNRMRHYTISTAQVLQVLTKPDVVIPTREGRYNATKKVGKRFIRVGYREEPARLVVVTVTPRRELG